MDDEEIEGDGDEDSSRRHRVIHIFWRSPSGRYKSHLLRRWDLQDHTSSANGRPDDSETKVL